MLFSCSRGSAFGLTPGYLPAPLRGIASGPPVENRALSVRNDHRSLRTTHAMLCSLVRAGRSRQQVGSVFGCGSAALGNMRPRDGRDLFGSGLEEFGDEPGPTGLMRGADASAGVAVEIFVEEHVVTEVGVAGEFGVIFQHRALAVGAPEEEPGEAAGEFECDFVDGDESTGASGAFHFEIVAVVVVELLERLDEEIIHGHPDGAAPI